ncbi:hypothetical protein PR002_g21472 [Phytophthora rubi]|nr:hypothetical protein PR002_g21472 [Phytophthora rubi]
MDARIRHYVWHGQFKTDVSGLRAWLDADLAALPRSTGGLAIPDIRAELYALAAVTVSKWAVTGTAQMHIVGDILFHNRAGGRAPAVYITPEYAPVAPSGIHRRPTLWSMGRAMLSQAGAPDPQDTDNMGAYAAAAYACEGYSADWNGSHLIVDCTAMLASLVGDKCSQALQERGRVQLEWLPYADIGTLQVYARDGNRKTLAAACGRKLNAHNILKDFVKWTRRGTGHIVFTFNIPHLGVAQRTMAEDLTRVLVTNFTEIATHALHPNEVRFTATTDDHPVVAALRVRDDVEVAIHSSVIGPPALRKVASQGELTATLRAFMAPDIVVHTVHPHPLLSRQVCLWVGYRRWSRRRGELKARAAAASVRR